MYLTIAVIKEAIELIENNIKDKQVIKEQSTIIIKYAKELKEKHGC